jgi:Na+/H+ antiporter NhaD/arsenite permease-like protein
MYFLVLLVATASMLPTDAFRPIMERMSATGMTYALGVLSAFFDNIPLTKFAMDLGGFDWGLLAYSVGFGGSATWFGSSAGVALGTQFPELYDTRKWLIPFLKVHIAYLVGFCVYLLWHSFL